MSKNYVQDGGRITYSNTGAAIASGDVVIVGNLICVAITDIAATTGVGELATEGVWDLPKADAAVIAQGETVNYDVSASNFDDNAAIAAAGDITGGAIAWEGKGATTGENIKVKLTPAGAVT